jgi:hypothetical protein
VDEHKTTEQPGRPNLFQVIGSVLAAGFGVQSEKNRERDFAGGSAGTFVVVGIIATILFVVTLYLLVKLVIGTASA